MCDAEAAAAASGPESVCVEGGGGVAGTAAASATPPPPHGMDDRRAVRIRLAALGVVVVAVVLAVIGAALATTGGGFGSRARGPASRPYHHPVSNQAQADAAGDQGGMGTISTLGHLPPPAASPATQAPTTQRPSAPAPALPAPPPSALAALLQVGRSVHAMSCMGGGHHHCLAPFSNILSQIHTE